MTPEQTVHKSIATFLDVALTPPDWYSTIPAGWIPGGGKRGGLGAWLKVKGLKKGIPDILLIKAFNARAYWLEVKSGNKDAEDHQKACHVRLALAGCQTAVVHDIVETHDALVKWGFSLRARIEGQAIMRDLEAAE